MSKYGQADEIKLRVAFSNFAESTLGKRQVFPGVIVSIHSGVVLYLCGKVRKVTGLRALR